MVVAEVGEGFGARGEGDMAKGAPCDGGSVRAAAFGCEVEASNVVREPRVHQRLRAHRARLDVGGCELCLCVRLRLRWWRRREARVPARVECGGGGGGRVCRGGRRGEEWGRRCRAAACALDRVLIVVHHVLQKSTFAWEALTAAWDRAEEGTPRGGGRRGRGRG